MVLVISFIFVLFQFSYVFIKNSQNAKKGFSKGCDIATVPQYLHFSRKDLRITRVA